LLQDFPRRLECAAPVGDNNGNNNSDKGSALVVAWPPLAL
jgi:hypothetical protein